MRNKFFEKSGSVLKILFLVKFFIFVGIMHQKSSICSHPISIPHLYILSHMRMNFASVKACCVEMAESDNDEIVEQVYHYIIKSEYPSGVGEHGRGEYERKLDDLL